MSWVDSRLENPKSYGRRFPSRDLKLMKWSALYRCFYTHTQNRKMLLATHVYWKCKIKNATKIKIVSTVQLNAYFLKWLRSKWWGKKTLHHTRILRQGRHGHRKLCGMVDKKLFRVKRVVLVCWFNCERWHPEAAANEVRVGILNNSDWDLAYGPWVPIFPSRTELDTEPPASRAGLASGAADAKAAGDGLLGWPNANGGVDVGAR